MLCAPRGCGCSIVSDGTIGISGSGAQGDPITLAVERLKTVTSSTRPVSPANGTVRFETDTNRIIVRNASAWYGIALAAL